MTLLRPSVWFGALAVLSGCNFDLHSIPSIEDCMEAGVGNCGSSGNGASGGSGGTGGGNSGSGGVGGVGGVGGIGGIGGTGGCGPLQFACNSGDCILNTRVCDGADHCPDGSDEHPALCATGCGTCPTVNPASGTTCCIDPNTCGVQGFVSGPCLDVFNPGPFDPNCPAETLIGTSAAGCCRTDGRCGVQGNIAGFGCIAREEIPPAVGGPYPGLSCGGSIDRIPCTTNNECAPFGQVCGDIDTTTGQLFCIDSLPFGARIGQACSGALIQSECVDRLCNDALLECSAPCGSPAECRNDGGEPVCAVFTSGTLSLNLCGTRCYSNDYCRLNDQVCGVAQDTSGLITGMCTAVQQNGVDLLRGGNRCIDNTDCASGLCLPGGFGSTPVCATVCESSSQCTGLAPTCAPLNLSDGSRTDLYVCQTGPVPLP